MADAFWMQLGANMTFALGVEEKIIGITYWVDAEGLGAEGAEESSSLPESGWYFVSVDLPSHPERVAQGLELSRDMTEAELAQTVQDTLEVVANAVLVEGGDE
jgi:hypothetical protein